MTKKTPSEAEAEGNPTSGPVQTGSPPIHDELRSLEGLRGRLIEKLFVPRPPEGSWTSLPATN